MPVTPEFGRLRQEDSESKVTSPDSVSEPEQINNIPFLFHWFPFPLLVLKIQHKASFEFWGFPVISVAVFTGIACLLSPTGLPCAEGLAGPSCRCLLGLLIWLCCLGCNFILIVLGLNLKPHACQTNALPQASGVLLLSSADSSHCILGRP